MTSAHGTFDVNLIWKMISNWGEKTLAVSYDIKEYLINNYGVPADNISITINGIDTERYHPQADASKVIKEFGLHTDGRKILYVSRIDNEAAHIGFQLAEAAPALAPGGRGPSNCHGGRRNPPLNGSKRRWTRPMRPSAGGC